MKNIKSYLPVIATGLVILAATSIKPAKAQQENRPKKHEVVYLHGYENSFYSKIDTNGGSVWGYDGVKLQNADSSSGAPQYLGAVTKSVYDPVSGQYTSTITNQTQSFSQAIADLINSGFRIVSSDISSESGPKALLAN